MEKAWNDLSEADRAEFAAWQAERAKPAPVKMFKDMTPAEQTQFRRNLGRDPGHRSDVSIGGRR